MVVCITQENGERSGIRRKLFDWLRRRLSRRRSFEVERIRGESLNLARDRTARLKCLFAVHEAEVLYTAVYSFSLSQLYRTPFNLSPFTRTLLKPSHQSSTSTTIVKRKLNERTRGYNLNTDTQASQAHLHFTSHPFAVSPIPFRAQQNLQDHEARAIFEGASWDGSARVYSEEGWR